MRKLSLALLVTLMFVSPCRAMASASSPDDLIAKMKSALAPLFTENEDYTFSDLSVTEAGGGYRISGNATFFQISSVTLVATFPNNEVMARFELQFPGGSILPEAAQQKLAKQTFTNRIPADIRNVVTLNSLYLELAQNTISTVGIQFSGTRAWQPVSGITAKDITVDFNLNNPLSAVSVAATLKSNLTLGEVNIEVTSVLSSNPNDCVLTGEVKSLSFGNVLASIGMQKAPEWPDALWNLAMQNGKISVAPFAKTMALSLTSDFGEVEFYINGSTVPTEFMVGVSPPSDFSFAKVDPTLSVLDNVGLKNTALVLASSTQKTRLSLFRKLGQETEVTRGLTLLSLYDISAVSKELQNMIGKSSLLLRATVSNNPAEMKLMASLDSNIPLDVKKNVILKNVNFTLAPNPASFTISLGGMLEVTADKRKLLFTSNITVDITNVELSIQGIMNGTWDRPFDTNGVQVSDLGIGVGVTFKSVPIPMPTLQFKGKIKVGNPASPAFAGDMTFALTNDLAALEGLASTGIAVRTAADTWAQRTIAVGSGLAIADAGGVAGNPTVTLDATLVSLAAFNTNGLLTQTAADTFTGRTLQAPAAGFSITNPAGIAGDPTFTLTNDLSAVEGLSGTGFGARTGTDAWSVRTLTAPAAGLSITNPAGVAGDPTFALANDLAALEGLA